MNVAFLKKELRELAGIAALALLAQALMVLWQGRANSSSLLPDSEVSPSVLPFVTCEFPFYFVLLQAILAVALGFRQTVWEHTHGTFLLLLHRPMAWPRILVQKLLSGLLVLAVAGAIPILLYVLIIAGPRPVPAPFEWSMTDPCWRAIALSLPLYVAAFASGLRAARWFGTRLLPVLGMGLLLTPLLIVANVVLWPALAFNTALAWLALKHVASHREYA